MELIKTGVAGTLESGDIYIEIQEGGEGIEVELQSTVYNLYGRRIQELLKAEAVAMGLTAARIVANDKGALDCTIRARFAVAALRGVGQEEYPWTAEGRREA